MIKEFVLCLIFGGVTEGANQQYSKEVIDAMKSENIIELKKLLDYKKEYSSIDFERTYVDAIKNNKVKIIEFLLEQKLIDLNYRNKNQDETALHIACRSHNNYDMVKLLVKHGADVNAIGNTSIKYTPLFMAANMDDMNLFKLLLSMGAKPKDFDLVNVVSHSNERNKRIQYIKMILESGVKIDAYHLNKQAIHEAEDFDTFKFLIDNGANINARIKGSDAYLIHSALKMDAKTLKFILENGGDVNSLDAALNTPLHLVVLGKNAEKFEILINYKADLDIKNKMGKTARDLIKECGSDSRTFVSLGGGPESCLSQIKFMLYAGCTMDMVNSAGDQILHTCARERNSIEILKFILDKKVDIETKNARGLTPLLIACDTQYYGSSQEIDLALIKAGANLEAEDARGNTPLILARDRNKYAVVDTLVKQGADIHHKNKQGESFIGRIADAKEAERFKKMHEDSKKVKKNKKL